MKKTTINKSWMFNETNELCGVDLGSEFCAEHESGIGMIKAAFGIDGMIRQRVTKIFGIPLRTKEETVFGIASRTIREIPDQFVHGSAGKYMFVGFYDSLFAKWVDTLVKDSVREIKVRKSSFVAYWCERGFLLVSDDHDKISAIRDAFMSKDIAIFMGNSKFISNDGLIISIASKLDSNMLVDMEKSDKSRYDLNKKSEATGIHKKLKDAGCHYYALSARWSDDAQTDIKFWMNPQQQQMYNAGWFTVAELEQWINNEGPVIKKKHQ